MVVSSREKEEQKRGRMNCPRRAVQSSYVITRWLSYRPSNATHSLRPALAITIVTVPEFFKSSADIVHHVSRLDGTRVDPKDFLSRS